MEVSMPTEVQALVDSVERVRSSLLHVVGPLNETQAGFKPLPTEWSVVEICEHLYLAELGGITKVWGAMNAVRAGERWNGDLPNRGKSIEEIIASTWKSKEAAPPVATPHLGGPLAAWVSAIRSLRPVLQDLAIQLEGQQLDAIIYPHFLSGPLDARQRLEFLRYHIERHISQVKRLLTNSAFPK
jgi:hypothetical protein